MQERRASNTLSNDLLLQIIDKQYEHSEVLHELKGDISVRVRKLEDAQHLNWWMTYVITPVLMVLHGAARAFGVKI